MNEIIPSRRVWNCAFGQINLTANDVHGVRFRKNHWPDMRFNSSKLFIAMIAVKENALRDAYLKSYAA